MTVMLAMGCGGGSLGGGGGAGGGGVGGGGTGGQTTDASADATPAALAALCDPPLGERLAVPTVAAMQDALRHSWVLCSPIGLFRHAQAGITIGPDDRWSYLLWSVDHLEAQHGLDNEGSVEYLATGDAIDQVNFVSDLNLTIIAAPPIFSDSPRMLVINNEGVETYTYAQVP